MVDGTGRLRPHWRSLLGAFTALGGDGMAERERRLDRAFVEEGITTVLPGSAGRPWRCDPVPLPLPASEFAALKAGLGQRARLLARLLEDIYGPQTIAAEGLLPPALVFANPGFLRPCRFADARPAAAQLRRRPDPRPGRRLAGAGRPHRRDRRRGLCAREPAPAVAGAARGVPPGADAPVAAVFRHLAGFSLRRLAPGGRPIPRSPCSPRARRRRNGSRTCTWRASCPARWSRAAT